MQNVAKKMMLGLAIALTCSSVSSSAQIYVNVRPRHEVIVERPVQPSPRHVWIDEEWRPRNGQYQYNGGRWEAPPRRGRQWHPGHWNESGRGQMWTRGRWR